MSTIDDLIEQEVGKLQKANNYLQNFAIPHYSSELHKCLDENISLNEEIRSLRNKLNNPESDTRKKLLLDSLIKTNKESKVESIKESIEKSGQTIDGHKDRSKPSSRNKNRKTGD